MASKSAKDIIKAARRPERTVTVCVRGDLVADIEALEAALKAEVQNKATNGRVGSKSKAAEYARQIEALRAEMAEHQITFRLRSLLPAEWRALVAKYPPKKGDPLIVDMLGLMGEAIPACTIAPELDAEDWANLNANTANGDFGKLIDAVWEMHTRSVDVPKSPLASAISRGKSDD